MISLVLLGEGMDESYGDHSDSNCYSDHSLTGSPAFLDDGKTSSSFFFIRAYPESGHFYPRHPGSLLRTSEALPLELPDDCSLVRSCFEMFAAVIHRDFSRQFQLLKREHSSSYVTGRTRVNISKQLLSHCCFSVGHIFVDWLSSPQRNFG